MLPAAALVAALAVSAGTGWQLRGIDETGVPPGVMHAAAHVEIAVIDTGADISVPEIAERTSGVYDARNGTSNVQDENGHGTFVASIAAAYGGDARLLLIKAGSSSGAFTDATESAAIRYAVRHGARIINLSIGGPSTSKTERAAIRFAVGHDVLVVTGAGNDHGMGNPVEYPAALVQPVGSDGTGGSGLVVAASEHGGRHAAFSGTGSWISIAAPGVAVYGALGRGRYGFGSGTSFAAAEVSGAAALVWAANPALTALGVAHILEQTASGHGTWTPTLGYGVVDATAAVDRARSLSDR
ncbi:MAG TPA: S8 family serine peptidase [Gaiellaceae bacterium]